MFIFIFYGGESRYLSIVFPQLAIIGGVFLGKVHESIKNRWLPYFLLAIVLGVCLNNSFSMALSTSFSQRFSDDYISALTWLKTNTTKDALVFTTYCGSVNYFGQRDCFWASIPEFPLMMEANNSTYIYDTLKNYNTTHILIWNALIGEDYYYPERNLVGIFNINFYNLVMNDQEHFKIVYQNQNNIIFTLE